MPTFGRLLARITVPTGGWDTTVGGTTATVAAGTYYLPDLLEEVADKFATAAGETCVATADIGENGTGQVTITFGAATAVQWVDTDLRDLLGFDDNLLAEEEHESPHSARSVWLPNCPYDARNDHLSSYRGHRRGDYRDAHNMGGHVWARHGQHHVREESLRWAAVKRERVQLSHESVANQSFERFFLDGVWGEAAWGTPGGPIRFYPDAGNEGIWGTYRVLGAGELAPEHYVDGWAGGPWTVQMPPLVRVPGTESLGLPPAANFSWSQDEDAKALHLERASNQFASISDASQAGLDITGAIAFVVLFRLSALPTVEANTTILVGKDNAGTQRSYHFGIDNAGKPRLAVFDSSNAEYRIEAAGAVAWQLNRFYRLSGYFDPASSGVKGALRLDGAELSVTSVGTPPAVLHDSTSNVTIGGLTSGRLNGDLRNVQVYDRALTDDEIASLDFPVSTDGLQGAWSFDGVYTDSSGNGNTLTSSGSPTFEDVLAVQLTDTTPDPDSMITDQEWTADGKNFRGAAPYLLVDAAGDYPTQLTVTKEGGSQSSKTKTVRVEQTVRQTIGVSLLTSGSNGTDGMTFATASISPTGNAAVYLAVASRLVSGGPPVTPTASGCGLTWVAVTNVDNGGAVPRKLTVFRAMGASPSSGALTIDFGVENQTAAAWSVVECTNVDTSGTDASGATVQSVTNSQSSGGTSIEATLAALEHTNNVHLAFVVVSSAGGVTHDTDFAELSDDAIEVTGLEAEWAANQTVCTATHSSANSAIASIEVKAG
jgi:hypothetical protein